ncbi:peptidylprolyl isomerase [Anabaena cylindrica FACHB-243]|uniref:peptidylprolyl isomerase n=1 Tax=Anabaena cylindrica (strain ATCC 27899 / PCC 7122) TaxID=272123 RepID=K9ZJN9_ANACC|nr:MULTISPECIES: peptidylprolyl isomerase [Anabaena]AFZ59458.1 PpiC-type peptidyl-prolyl cis-trans isomerase [Anabaena cylindrica PCC 7122]MBD2417613.1 peptidylprolyl isomerase [Anabaena cylindrica FACHB-243]MBY5283195.1 peptidylprolyl isomerase [Anabaena sp. CCAP 1446/1C]MBY5308638.1 peptidylprolyl isomerase [Anabaena sp. CCAP 1446/1C]MCM2405374.1 peptidylprolyl isomerase [Anabaena sp. CCAP 1446/1C]
MSQPITITKEDILKQVQYSCKIPEIIEQIVSRKVIIAAAEEAGIQVETEELQTVADQIRLVHQLNSADDTWKWLEKHHLSLDDFEDIVYTNLISNKLLSHLFADQVEPYFFENQLNYMGVVMYEVIFSDEDLAIELFYSIKEGEMSFYDVAHKYIEDQELRRKGGYLGLLRRRDLKPEISAAVFAVKPPQLLKPIVTSKGVHLILVEELIQPDLNEKLQLRTHIISDLFSEWLKQQIEQYEVIKSF